MVFVKYSDSCSRWVKTSCLNHPENISLKVGPNCKSPTEMLHLRCLYCHSAFICHKLAENKYIPFYWEVILIFNRYLWGNLCGFYLSGQQLVKQITETFTTKLYRIHNNSYDHMCHSWLFGLFYKSLFFSELIIIRASNSNGDNLWWNINPQSGRYVHDGWL